MFMVDKERSMFRLGPKANRICSNSNLLRLKEHLPARRCAKAGWAKLATGPRRLIYRPVSACGTQVFAGPQTRG